jgi:hypothetical protein
MNVPVRLSRISVVAAIVMLSGLVVAPLPAQSAPPQRGMESPVASQSAGVLAQVEPATAAYCDRNVCTYVYGGGLYVSAWSTKASNQSYKCTQSHFFVNGQNVYSPGQQCGSSDFRQTWNVNQYYENGSLLCNTWDGIAGQSCAVVWTNQ